MVAFPTAELVTSPIFEQRLDGELCILELGQFHNVVCIIIRGGIQVHAIR